MRVLKFLEVNVAKMSQKEYLEIVYNLDDCSSEYSNNLKLGGLRLGQSILFVSKNKNFYRISLISSNKQLNAQVEDMVIYYYNVRVEEKEVIVSNQT